MTALTSIIVDFGDRAGANGAPAHLSAAIDTVEGGLNQGKTSFLPGESVYFLVWQSDNVEHDMPIVSVGAVSVYGGAVPLVARTREQDIVFSNTAEAQVPVPAASLDNVVWMGTSLGALELGADRMTLRATAPGVAVARVRYTTVLPVAYRLHSPQAVHGETDFSVLVYIRGRVVS